MTAKIKLLIRTLFIKWKTIQLLKRRSKSWLWLRLMISVVQRSSVAWWMSSSDGVGLWQRVSHRQASILGKHRLHRRNLHELWRPQGWTLSLRKGPTTGHSFCDVGNEPNIYSFSRIMRGSIWKIHGSFLVWQANSVGRRGLGGPARVAGIGEHLGIGHSILFTWRELSENDWLRSSSLQIRILVGHLWGALPHCETLSNFSFFSAPLSKRENNV